MLSLARVRQMLSMEDFITTVFCCVDDLLKEVINGQPVRSRGFQPSLSDSEVITMEIVAEFNFKVLIQTKVSGNTFAVTGCQCFPR